MGMKNEKQSCDVEDSYITLQSSRPWLYCICMTFGCSLFQLKIHWVSVSTWSGSESVCEDCEAVRECVVSWLTALTGCVWDIDEKERLWLLRAMMWLANSLVLWFLLAEFLSFSHLTSVLYSCADEVAGRDFMVTKMVSWKLVVTFKLWHIFEIHLRELSCMTHNKVSKSN